ncbi:minor capsid protein [bacterium]|nr:minor capsid protein [bacterium]
MAENVNTKIYDSRVDRAAMIRRYEENLRGKTSLIIDGHSVRVDKLIREADLSPRGVRKLQAALEIERKKAFKETYQTSKRSLLELAQDQLSYAYQNLEASVSNIWRVQTAPRRIADDLVLKKPLYKDNTLLQGWSGVSVSERKRLEAVIRKGIDAGDTPAQIARDVRKKNVHKITANQSRALVTTAMTSVQAQADQAVYAANDKLLAGWQYVSVLDSRTTPVCVHRDGEVYPAKDVAHLPPAHYGCRSTTTPVVKDWDTLSKLEGAAEIRKRNLKKLTPEQLAFYDGATPAKETYGDWLSRQNSEVQLRHLGSQEKMDLFTSGQLSISKFSDIHGKLFGIKKLRQLTDSELTAPGQTVKFASAKRRLDSLHLGISRPEDVVFDVKMQNKLREYYLLQAGDLDGTLSLTNYRGALIGTKKQSKRRVLTKPPTDEQLKFNPITGQYEDVRMYQPNPAALSNNLRLVEESAELSVEDKEFILKFVNSLDQKMGTNERAVVADNLRIMFTRYRKNPEAWANFKAVSNSQMKFDVMNVSDYIETQIRKDSDVLKRLKDSNYIDPVLGSTQLEDLGDNLIDNIRAKNKWEDKIAPKLAAEMQPLLDTHIPLRLQARLDADAKQQFYLRLAHRLALADGPDRDQLAIAIGRDLYNSANINGSRQQWFKAGLKIVESKQAEKFYKLETFGVQKRRMKSRMGGSYFGPYYDTLAFNLRIVDPRIQEYAKLNRKVDMGLRVGVTDDRNRLLFRKGYKTYFTKTRLGLWEDTRIPITSTKSYGDFPEEFVEDSLVDALTWTSKAKYEVDEDFYDFTQRLLYFEDDRGKAKYYNSLNEYRKYIASRGDSYERFKAMGHFRANGLSFSNNPFIDHRARVYDRGLIGPQSGESFRPFLNTDVAHALGREGFENMDDQIGAFLGGLNDTFEGRYNSLSITGRQKIAKKWRKDMITIGHQMRRGKPRDIRNILENKMVQNVDAEEQAKFFRFALELSKIDDHLGGDFSSRNLHRLSTYETKLALEQDASSSGAQIIALTTRNKQLAELSNVVPTNQKRRLYDEIAAATYNDPRFKRMNRKLGLNEKDLRKAAKAQNMVTFYGAGERTGVMNIENKLSKVLDRDSKTLVVKAADRDAVLDQISAQAARYERFDPEVAADLKALRADVRDVFNKGEPPGNEIMSQLYFLDPATKEVVEKMSKNYSRVVTPDDFQQIAMIMSEHLEDQVPILGSFTKFFGRLADDYLKHSDPSSAAFDWKSIGKESLLGTRSEDKLERYILPDWAADIFGVPKNKSLSLHALESLGVLGKNSNLADMIYGVQDSKTRRTGAKYLSVDIAQVVDVFEIEVFRANKLPKSWTNVPWVNFDGNVIEQNFTQTFEERLRYKDRDGNWVTNVVQVPQKTEATWWEQIINKSGKINDIADVNKARTAFAVNGNHSNDAVIVKKFHQWGKRTGIPTSTIHDAFFANAAHMVEGRNALRGIYAETLQKNVIRMTLQEMKKRGLPKAVHDDYLEEAIELGLIPIPGRSKVGGKKVTENDILKAKDILEEVPEGFASDYSWYGVG